MNQEDAPKVSQVALSKRICKTLSHFGIGHKVPF